MESYLGFSMLWSHFPFRMAVGLREEDRLPRSLRRGIPVPTSAPGHWSKANTFFCYVFCYEEASFLRDVF